MRRGRGLATCHRFVGLLARVHHEGEEGLRVRGGSVAAVGVVGRVISSPSPLRRSGRCRGEQHDANVLAGGGVFQEQHDAEQTT